MPSGPAAGGPLGPGAAASLLEMISRFTGAAAALDDVRYFGRIESFLDDSFIETARGPDSVAALARAAPPPRLAEVDPAGPAEGRTASGRNADEEDRMLEETVK